MVVLKYYIESRDLAKMELLRRAVKSFEYIFKFIIRSRFLFAAYVYLTRASNYLYLFICIVIYTSNVICCNIATIVSSLSGDVVNVCSVCRWHF